MGRNANENVSGITISFDVNMFLSIIFISYVWRVSLKYFLHCQQFCDSRSRYSRFHDWYGGVHKCIKGPLNWLQTTIMPNASVPDKMTMPYSSLPTALTDHCHVPNIRGDSGSYGVRLDEWHIRITVRPQCKQEASYSIPRIMHTVLLCFALLWFCNRS